MKNQEPRTSRQWVKRGHLSSIYCKNLLMHTSTISTSKARLNGALSTCPPSSCMPRPPTCLHPPSLPHDWPFPSHGHWQVPPIVAPQILRPKTRRSPKHRWLKQVRTTSKSSSLSTLHTSYTDPHSPGPSPDHVSVGKSFYQT